MWKQGAIGSSSEWSSLWQRHKTRYVDLWRKKRLADELSELECVELAEIESLYSIDTISAFRLRADDKAQYTRMLKLIPHLQRELQRPDLHQRVIAAMRGELKVLQLELKKLRQRQGDQIAEWDLEALTPSSEARAQSNPSQSSVEARFELGTGELMVKDDPSNLRVKVLFSQVGLHLTQTGRHMCVAVDLSKFLAQERVTFPDRELVLVRPAFGRDKDEDRALHVSVEFEPEDGLAELRVKLKTHALVTFVR
jgi:hypothetical protein